MHLQVHKVRAEETNGSAHGLNGQRRVTGLRREEGSEFLSVPLHLQQPRTPLPKVKWPWFQWKKFWREELSPFERGMAIVLSSAMVMMVVISAYCHFRG
ncbi:MAG: hypothetical protein EXS51_01450 [Candidatus Taylorbacteria bacterium]|nr:hypothetical protein [Candidatus Taylorbacteria bacterium]